MATMQVALALTAALLVASGSASPAGFGLFGKGTEAPPSENTDSSSGSIAFPNPLEIPKRVIGGILGGKKDSATPSGPTSSAAPEHHHHHHLHDAAPKVSSTAAPKVSSTAAPKVSSTAAPKISSTAAPTTAAAPTSSSAAASVSTTTATPAPTEAASTKASETSSEAAVAQRSEFVSSGNATVDKCREHWLEITNSSINENTDILAVLLENGGFPGQLDGQIKWERNASEGRPNRWTYMWGDTDYKTYIRVERGEIDSKTTPAQGVTPSSLSGEVWWSPPEFCGKLRHAKYSQDPELRASNQPKVCFIEGDRVICWSDPACVEPLAPGTTCPRGGVSGALMASLVG